MSFYSLSEAFLLIAQRLPLELDAVFNVVFDVVFDLILCMSVILVK